MADIKLVIKMPEEVYKSIINGKNYISYQTYVEEAIKNGAPLHEYMEELKRRLLIEVDGGTDDRYLRYIDVCDRIGNTVDTYIIDKQ